MSSVSFYSKEKKEELVLTPRPDSVEAFKLSENLIRETEKAILCTVDTIDVTPAVIMFISLKIVYYDLLDYICTCSYFR